MTRGRPLLTAVALASLAGATACDTAPVVRLADASQSDSAHETTFAEGERARLDSIVRARPGYIIDSIIPVEDEIRRFQATIPERPDTFSYGARSRQALVVAFVRALEHDDTTALAKLVVNRAEFAYLLYPTSPNTRAPYRQSPELVWLQRSAASSKGAARLLARLGGRPLRFAGFDCPIAPMREGENRIWSSCLVRRTAPGGDTTRLRLFGSIVERGGRYKLVSLANGL